MKLKIQSEMYISICEHRTYQYVYNLHIMLNTVLHTDTYSFTRRSKPHTDVHVCIFSKTYILICGPQVADGTHDYISRSR